MQELGLMDIEMRASGFFDNVLNKDSKLFGEAEKVAAYDTFLTLMDNEEIEPKKKIRRLKLPKHLLNIQTKFFIEMVNGNCNPQTFEGFEVLVACFYRVDWSKDYDEDELENNIAWFTRQPFLYALWGWKLFNELGVLLKETYPILYGGKQDEEIEDGRKLYDMLNALSKDDPNNWERSGNLPLNVTFAYLEQKKIELIKAKQNERKH